jgi:glycosyltransferase involved in cell wall biosynthesis
VKSLRVLWLSPWMRPLARVYTEALRRRGVEVLLVTSDQHPGSDIPREYELVLDPRLRSAASWPATFEAGRRIRAWQADVVITELVRDPRWIAFAGTAPRVQLVHDDRAHGLEEHRPRHEQAIFDRWGARSAATVVFSDYVAAAVGDRRDIAGTTLHTVPLTSDLDPMLVEPPKPAMLRRDFVLIGRLNPYKNIDVVLDAWDRHVNGSGWRGDDLVLIGQGPPITRTLPKYTVWRSGTFHYRDVITTLAEAKGSVVHHRRASQSGVQVLSMQLGVVPIVSPVGALPEFQPPGLPPVDVDDVSALAAAFDTLADPVVAADQGAAAAQDYARRFCADRAAGRLLDVLLDVRGTAR